VSVLRINKFGKKIKPFLDLTADSKNGGMEGGE